MEARRKALEGMEKAELVEIVLRLQDQLRDTRRAFQDAFEDGTRLARARQDAELVEKGGAAVSGRA